MPALPPHAPFQGPPPPPYVHGFPRDPIDMSLLPYFENHMEAHILAGDVIFNSKFI